MRQRAMIAMSIINDPELIIADEPTTALDVTVQAQVLETLGRVREAFNTAIILITHDLGVIAGMADRVMVMYAGRLVEKGLVDDVYEQPRMPYTVGLLGSVPTIDHVGELTPIQGAPPSLINVPPGCPFSPRCPLVARGLRADRARPACRPTSPTTRPPACTGTSSSPSTRRPSCSATDRGGAMRRSAVPPSPSTTNGADAAAAGRRPLQALPDPRRWADPPTSSARCTPCPACRSTSARARRSASWASRDRARRRRAGRCCSCTSRRRARCASTASSSSTLGRRQDARDAAGHADRVPGPVRVAQPEDAGERHHRRAAEGARPVRQSATGRRRSPSLLRRGRPATRARQPLPARVLRRPAPARRHRQGARPRAPLPGARRAGVGARRQRPGRRRQPARRSSRTGSAWRSCSSPTTCRWCATSPTASP